MEAINLKKYKYGTPGRVLNYAAPVYDFCINFFMPNYDKKMAELICGDISEISSVKNMLDIGCGTGAITGILANKLKTNLCVGIDAAPKMIQTAVKKHSAFSNITFITTVSEKLPFSNESFDCIVNTMFLHHIPYDSKVQTFKEIYRILKPGGIVYTIDFSRPKRLAGQILIKILAALLIQNEIAENAQYSLDFFLQTTGFKNIKINNLKFGLVYKVIGIKS